MKFKHLVVAIVCALVCTTAGITIGATIGLACFPFEVSKSAFKLRIDPPFNGPNGTSMPWCRFLEKNPQNVRFLLQNSKEQPVAKQAVLELMDGDVSIGSIIVHGDQGVHVQHVRMDAVQLSSDRKKFLDGQGNEWEMITGAEQPEEISSILPGDLVVPAVDNDGDPAPIFWEMGLGSATMSNRGWRLKH